MTRYQLPAALGGGEMDEYRHVDGGTEAPIGTVAFLVNGCIVAIARALLTELPPPIPAEPEPGAYLIGGVLAVRFREDPGLIGHNWVYGNRGVGYDDAGFWPAVWGDLGGPDVAIVPLIVGAEVVEPVVDLPAAFRCADDGRSMLKIRQPDHDDHIAVFTEDASNVGIVYLTRGDAELAARALLAAAQAEANS